MPFKFIAKYYYDFIYRFGVPEVNNASEAIKIAKAVIKEAGYDSVKITNTDYDEDEEVWTVDAESNETGIQVTIDAESGEVDDFTTE